MPDSHIEQERQLRRQRWRAITDLILQPHPVFVLDEEVVLSAEEAAYFEALD